MEKKSHAAKDSADHQDRKDSRIVVMLALLTVTCAIALTVVWFTLIGYTLSAVFAWIAR